MVETILVFPAGLPDAQRFRAEAQARGAHVIGASSLGFDAAAADYEAWETLPYVHEDGFAQALGEAVRRRGVQAVFSPHEVVSGVLTDVLETVAPGVRLIAPNPALATERAYAALAGRAENCESRWFALSDGHPPLTRIERAGLLRLLDTIPGMSDLDKAAALIGAMRHAPEGDVVEIGSWWGRSAALLVMLARRWDIGPVLCVDPWANSHLDQGVAVLDQASARIDAEAAFRIFQINLAPLAGGRLNYLRAPSTEAARAYRSGLTVRTETFGTTTYEGRISLLHIDGNHAYESVAADAEAWVPKVKPGGWIVFDDYVWAFGDGPRLVGDDWLQRLGDKVALSFVIGTALFVKLAP